MKAPLIHVRDALCVLCLVLLVLSELYSAADLALDDHLHLPSWEHPLRWSLFGLPCALAVGLVLLVRSDRRRLGFYCVVASLLLYAPFICLEVFQVHAEPGDWISLSVWISFCAIGIGAARVLMVRSIQIRQLMRNSRHSG